MTNNKVPGIFKSSLFESKIEKFNSDNILDFAKEFGSIPSDIIDGSRKKKFASAEDIIEYLSMHMDRIDSKKFLKDAYSKFVGESVDEAFIGPFVFNDRMSDEELKAMYNDALGGYANYSKGFQHPKSDYKQAYQEIEKILKKRGVSVDESKGHSTQLTRINKSVVESKESDALAKEIDKAMIKIDDSMSYTDFALAVGKILKDEYGKHTFKGFMEVLHKDLGI